MSPLAPARKRLSLKEVGAFLGKVVAWLPPAYRPTQKFVAHAVATGLSAAAVAVLHTGASDALNGAIVVVAGLVAHYVIPNGP